MLKYWESFDITPVYSGDVYKYRVDDIGSGIVIELQHASEYGNLPFFYVRYKDLGNNYVSYISAIAPEYISEGTLNEQTKEYFIRKVTEKWDTIRELNKEYYSDLVEIPDYSKLGTCYHVQDGQDRSILDSADPEDILYVADDPLKVSLVYSKLCNEIYFVVEGNNELAYISATEDYYLNDKYTLSEKTKEEFIEILRARWEYIKENCKYSDLLAKWLISYEYL